ncbi:MAG: helicase-related protein, partial [Vicinamibacteria bacterium]
KNLYRQTWHNGGVSEYDVELPPGDVRQRLTVALVQKKVSDLVGTKFGNSFQMGMLASFESFEQTATPMPGDTDGDEPPDEAAVANFDNADQGDSEVERLGVDTSVVNALALDHLKAFGREMAHPKMDALVDDLSGAWQEGRKALVFVRRIASVAELKRKLDERYDSWLIDRLKCQVPPEVWVQIEALLPTYENDHRERGRAVGEGPSDREDLGGSDTFFGWFFRGTGPPALRRNKSSIESGASLARALNQAGGSASTFFAQHHLAEVLDCYPERVLDELTRELSVLGGPDTVVSALKERARPFLPRGAGRRKRFEAIQYAGLDLLREHAASPERAQHARDLWQALDPTAESSADGVSVDPAAELTVETFFTALRSHPELLTCLTPPTGRRVTASQQVRDLYLANTLIATAARRGHSLVDLYIAFMQASGPAPLPPDDTSVSSKALDNFIGSLDRQRQTGDRSGAFYELQQISQAFDIIRKLNLPDTESETFKLSDAARSCANLLGGQQPTAGLSGRVNATAVRQFRMPGYPNVLVSTDVLQEGEDLHTFCDKVVHYGVAWTPSSMEQRTGRVDRLNSLAERRFMEIDSAMRDPRGDEKIQVQIPYVPDTIERVQTRRVVERMHRFTTLMHQGVDASTKRLYLDQEMIRESWAPPTIDHELTSAFEIKASDLSGTFRAPAVGPYAMIDWWRRITHLQRHALTAPWLEHASVDEERYTLFSSRTVGTRVQPFSLRLASRGSFALVQCLSPVGVIGMDRAAELNAHLPDVLSRITTVPHIEDREYDVALEGDVILGDPAADAARVHALIQRVTADADSAEQELTSLDLRLEEVQHTMSRDLDDD